MAVDPGTGSRPKRKRSKSLRRAETKARYQDVVRGAQQRIAQQYADDPVIGRVAPDPGGTRHRETADTLYKQTLGYGTGAASMIPSPVQVPLAAFSAAVLASDPSTREQFKGAKENLGKGDKKQQARAALDFALVTGAVDAGPGGSPPKRPAGADDIIEALPEAKKLRRKQEAGYSVERRKRAAAAEAAMQEGGEAGYQAALRELKGELPKLKFGALENFDQAAADELFTHVQKHPDFRPYEKVATQGAIKKVIEGGVPTRSEIKLLERAFGADIATQIAESVPFWKKAGNMGLSIINIPRSLMASMDLSAPFRQGLVLGARHPRTFAREWGPMLKAFKSEGAYDNVMDEIASRPSFKRMQDAKLQLTDFENLAKREEGFQSSLAETLTGGKRSPVRMSGRAYTAFLNKFRADAFDNYLRMADEQGLDLDDPRLLRSIASWVNHSTGRGSIKGLEAAMPPLTALFFSPRLIASRLQLLNPIYYASLHPFARKQALQGATQLLGAISLTLYMAKMAGADVGLDPRSSDFGKIKVGDTRVDIAGGFQQYVVNAYRIIKGETASSTTGEVTKLEGGFAKPSRWSIAGNFIENKMAPVPKFGMDWGKNENFAGEEFDLKREGSKLFLPIGGVSAYEAYQEGGAGPAALTGGLSGIGFGVLTYPAGEKKSSGGSSLRSSGGKRKKSLRSGGGSRRKSLRRN